MNFIQENWIAILSLIVALIGGVPGIITTIRHFRNKPILSFRVRLISTGEIAFESEGTSYRYLLLGGVLCNDGDRPLAPASFGLETRWRNEWTELTRAKLEPRLLEQIQASGQASFGEVRDLQRFEGAVAHATPVSGFLFFLTQDLTLDEIQSARRGPLRLICEDVFGRRHVHGLDMGGDMPDGPIEIPGLNTRIYRKQM